jgi:hypothetical protein
MKSNKASARLSVVGKLPEGYVILCRLNGDEYSFLTKTLGISVASNSLRSTFSAET